MHDDVLNDALNKVGKRLGNISALPEELRSQLQAAKTDELEDKILNVINKLDGVANIDEILVGLYKEYQTIQQRSYITNKLYRMIKAGLLIAVSGKKGVYRAV
jgi:hypothetical protein